MAVGGSKKVRKEFEGFSKYIGLFKGTVATINPTKEELNRLQGVENQDTDKELTYTGEKDGVETAKVTFWLEVEGEDGLFLPYTINLKNKVMRNKAGDKIQLVNCVGDTQWVEADENDEYSTEGLFENFMNFQKVLTWKNANDEILDGWEKGAKPAEVEFLGKKEFRPALVGEADLYEFMKAWLTEIDLNLPDAGLLLETKKLFNGNFKELQSLVGSELDTREYKGETAKTGLVALAYVSVDDADTDKQYQRIFKKFLPAYFIKYINLGNKFPDAKKQGVFDKWLKEVEGQYGVDGDYVLEPLKLYDPNEDIQTSKSTRPDEADKPTSSKF